MPGLKNVLEHQESEFTLLGTPDNYKQILGTWELESSENFVEFMGALGVSSFMLMGEDVMKPIIVFSFVNQLNQFKIETSTALKKCELVFSLGEPFVEITGDGRRTNSTVQLEGNIMTHVQNGELARGEKSTTIVRIFKESSLETECTITGPGEKISCKREWGMSSISNNEDDFLFQF
ncbi:myelin P2 protein isoform X2 [Eurytemora carolleeae]|uniref:myelin P2 protein isoform X2 n=1 Tax=Eurytemora carolleeae TaxID=1294199 RepID=UPI000C774730|nr:myelin P2 protein isoform X2 [Eurytemora carolleeae]|eukprot:XP_023348200.1 myelin P2 protein-like isoform X2 [Eurytemora affinis]